MTIRQIRSADLETLAGALGAGGGRVLRYGLAGLILWFGAFKFTAVEAAAIEPLLAESPFLAWLLEVVGPRTASRMIGSAEIVIGLLIAARPIDPRLTVAGGLGACAMFLTTLSFLITTPGMFTLVEGFPAPTSAAAFIVKDVILLGAALTLAGEAVTATLRSRPAGAAEPGPQDRHSSGELRPSR